MSIAHEAIRTPRTDSTYTISSVVLNDGLVSLATRRSSSRDATARLPLITSFWFVALVLDMLLLFGGWIWRDAACPAKDCNRPDTVHISLTAIALCDLHRTMLQSELLYTPVGSGQTRSTRSSGLAIRGYVRGKVLPAPRGCQRLGRVGSANQPPWPPVLPVLSPP